MSDLIDSLSAREPLTLCHTGMCLFTELICVMMAKRRETCLVIIQHKALLEFLGQAICWDQCRQDIVQGFRRVQETIPCATIIDTVHSIISFLYNESRGFGIPWPDACEMLKAIGAVTASKGSKLPAIVGMIRLLGRYCRTLYATSASSASFGAVRRSVDILGATIPKLLCCDCIDEAVMRELTTLHDIHPRFVATCIAPILCGDPDVLSDSRFAGALRSGLFATFLSVCAQFRHHQQDVRIPILRRGGPSPHGVGTDVIAAMIIERLYKIRLHRKTHKVLRSMNPLHYWNSEDKLESIFHDAQESVCANCLESFDRKALKWCKDTHMLEPFCSRECLKESWDAGACADFGDIVEEDDDRRMISLKRNIL